MPEPNDCRRDESLVLGALARLAVTAFHQHAAVAPGRAELTRVSDSAILTAAQPSRSPTPPLQPNDPSAMQEDTERRLVNLEIKAGEAEDTLDRLNDIIVRQQARIEWLLREVAQLRAQQSRADDAPTFRSLRDELPPHY